MKIRIDKTGYTEKPKRFTKIHNSLSNTQAVEIDFDEFCDLVGNQGHAFCVADFNGNKRGRDEFKSQQLFALDFDNKNRKVTIDEILTRAESYGLSVALAYETLSSENSDKFRVVFMTAFPISDVRAAEIIIGALMYIFPECDGACKDVARIFLGGKRVLFSQNKFVSVWKIMMEFPGALKVRDNKHYKSTLEKFCKVHRLYRMGGYPYVLEKRSDDCYEFFDSGRMIYFNFDKEEGHTNVKTEVKKIRNFNFNILENKCKLCEEFMDDKRVLHHNEIFGLATNFVNIEGGINVFLNHIEESSIEHYRDKDWSYYMHYMSVQGYTPMLCENFCPYHNECNHAANMLLTAKTNRNSVVKLKPPEFCNIEEAEKEVKDALYKSVYDTHDGINIIKAQTAIGKTANYVELIKNSSKKFIIAVPTNILKDEVHQRLVAEGVTGVVKTKSVRTLEEMESEFGEAVKAYNELGAYCDLIKYINKAAKEEDKEYLLEYIKPLADYCNEENRVIVTTHKKFINNRDEVIKEYEIIIDEDILFSSIKNNCTVNVADLRKVDSIGKVGRFLSEYTSGKEKYIKSEECTTYVSYKKMMRKGITSNVNGFMSATSLYVTKDGKVHCFIPPTFIKTKYTVLSATANEKMYQMFFPEMTVRTFNCKEAKQKGKLIQDCTRSYSRRDIDSDSDFFDKIKKENPGFNNIITFAKYEESVNCALHFGNTEGVNSLKGKNLLVVGTPHNNEFVYKLIATHLGIDTSDRMEFLEVEDTHYKYWLHTYRNLHLREIQLYFIKSELIQAVGRARLLRNDCTVKLYSSVPLPQAKIE